MTRLVGMLLSFGLASSAWAGTAVTLETREAGAPPERAPRVTRLEIEGRNLRADGPGGRHTLVYRGEAGVLELYDHREKSIFRLDRSTAQQMGRGIDGARGAVDALPEAQRRALESMLGIEPAPEPATLRATDRSDRVSGVPCRLLELHQGAARRAEICEAPPGSAGVPASALATVREAIVFAGDVAALLPNSFAGEGLALLPAVRRVDGVPLRVRAWPPDAPASETRIVDAVPRTVAPERFQAPAGYRPGLGIQVGPEAGRARPGGSAP